MAGASVSGGGSGGGVVAIIPARMASTRFPGKVLADKTGWPLVRHVHECARSAAGVRRVVVATDDERVRAAVLAFGGDVVMTSPNHPNGTSRLAEACELLGLADDEIVVNVQGDEPELDGRLIDAAAEALQKADERTPVATVAVPIEDARDAANPNIVKVVVRRDGNALYFSRAEVPFDRDGGGAARLRHVGLYAYRRGFLRRYTTLASTPLEQAEKLEQLRVLEHGYGIAVAVCPWARGAGVGVDTPEQYEAFVGRWRAGRGQGLVGRVVRPE